MAGKEQHYGTHRRYNTWHHFVAQPIIFANLIAQIVCLSNDPSGWNTWQVIFAFGLLIFSFTARSMSLKAQDRVIRLEERLRLSELMPGDRTVINSLRPSQLIALRFAADDEVVDLARRAANGELATPDQIKKSIRNWRPDYLRV